MFEIMACGRPLLASVAGEAAEILEASGAAIVVPPEDVEAIAEALDRLAADSERAADLGARGRPFVAAHYDRDALAARYLELLDAVGTKPR